MGLDMYLKKKIFIGANYEHRKITGTINVLRDEKPVEIDFKKVSEIVEQAGYWRKANQIHSWFVNNVQDGVDECQEAHVPFEKITELKNLCKEVLETKDTDLLAPSAGCFFGGTGIDEYYFEDLKETIDILEQLDDNGEYYYQSSW